MDNIKSLLKLVSKTEGNQNLFEKVVELISEMEGTQRLADNFSYLILSRPFDILVRTVDD